ncbi:MAG: HAD hydrolase-like protein, partial [Verrucomicrobiales bacterium]|nr:HAD hydrolase-like protein [Verrucomicrobiales bacterium]
MKKITAVIFDMDGLLIDTEGPSQLAWKSAVAQLGKSIDDEVLLGLIGCHIDDWIATLGEHFEMDLKEVNFLK